MTRTRHRWIMLEGFQIVKNDKPYLDRLRVVQTPLFSIYLHRIHTPDVDEFPHDHPWWFASLVLSGAYVECVYSDPLNLGYCQIRRRPRGSLRQLSRGKAHQITEISGVLWTLVLTGPHHQSWDFWTSNGPMDWKQVNQGVGL